MVSKLVSYGIILNFNKALDSANLVSSFTAKGFKKKIFEKGFLVAEGSTIEKQSSEFQSQKESNDLIHEYALIGKYTSLYPFYGKPGTNLSIHYNFGLEKSNINIIDNVVRELAIVTETLSKDFDISSNNIGSSDIEVMTLIHGEKNPPEVLSKIVDIHNIDFSLSKDMKIMDLEMKRIDNTIELSKIADKGWTTVRLMAKNNYYLVTLHYKSNIIDEIIQKLTMSEKLSSEIIKKLENLC